MTFGLEVREHEERLRAQHRDEARRRIALRAANGAIQATRVARRVVFFMGFVCGFAMGALAARTLGGG